MNAEDARALPLCVDCDGTLIKTDLLHEALLLLLKQSVWSLLWIPLWLWRGKAYFKVRLAERVRFDWSCLPYNPEVLKLIKEAKALGCPVVLATASPATWAQGISSYLGLFDETLATDEAVNLSGHRKADALVARFGQQGFTYIGDSRVDYPVWRSAQASVVVSSNPSLVARAREISRVVEEIRLPKTSSSHYIRALRVHQWLKNLLVFVPIAAAHRISERADQLATLIAFVAFCLCASAVYIINDLLDLESDRKHRSKCRRPFASAAIPVAQGAFAAPLLLLACAALATRLPWGFIATLAVYFLTTLTYSIRLKRQVIVDVMLLAALYTMRVIAGAAAIQVIPSFWLICLSIFAFLSLALIKRYAELWVLQARKGDSPAGRGYQVSDLPVLMALGASSAMASVMVMALYINEPQTQLLYPSTTWLWAIPPLLLYWNSRLWMKAGRGEVHEDPVLFALRDWQSIATAGLIGVCIALARLPA